MSQQLPKWWPYSALLALGAVGLLLAKQRAPAGPVLKLPQYGLDLGVGKPNETLSGTFDLWNAGEEPLEYSISATCGCTQLEPAQGEIPPHSSADILIAVQLASAGTERHVTLQVQTNDPAAKRVTYQVSASCPSIVDVEPRNIDFGRLRPGERKSQRLRIRGGNPANLKPGEITWSCNSSLFEIHQVNSEHADHVLELQVTWLGQGPEEVTRAELEVQHADGSAFVDLQAAVVGELVFAPRIIVWNAQLSDRKREATLLVWRSDGQPLGKLSECRAPDGVTVTEESHSPTLMRRTLRVVLAPNVQLPIAATLECEFQGAQQVACVKLKLPRPPG